MSKVVDNPLDQPSLNKPIHDLIKQVLRDSLTVKLEISDANASDLIFLVKVCLLLDGEELTESYDTLSVPLITSL